MSPQVFQFPSIVQVFPEVVCPYIKIVAWLPCKNYSTTLEQHQLQTSRLLWLSLKTQSIANQQILFISILFFFLLSPETSQFRMVLLFLSMWQRGIEDTFFPYSLILHTQTSSYQQIRGRIRTATSIFLFFFILTVIISYDNYLGWLSRQFELFSNMSSEAPKKQNKKKDPKQQQDLSVEDKELKEKIDAHCQRLIQNEMTSLRELKQIVRSATTAMTSVPKPFKFLKTHYQILVQHFNSKQDSHQKAEYADFLSVLSMIFGQKGARTSLYYLLKGTNSNFTQWGHEYVSNLASDVGRQYEIRIQNNQPNQELIILVDKIVPYFVVNNAEHDAIDLLLIVDKLQDIKTYVAAQNFSKVYMYLSAVCGYSSDQDELVTILTIIYQLAMKLQQYTIALRMAIKLDDHSKIKQVFAQCPDQLIKKQLAFNAARQKIYIPDLGQEIQPIISNKLLSKFYIDLANDLQVQQPKHPRDVFKVHLQQNYKSGEIKNTTLYSIYVNAFVNAGLTKDTLMIDDQESNAKRSFALEVSQDLQIAAVASLGLLCPWDYETIDNHLMTYIDNEGKYIKAGASLGVGICTAGVNDDNDIAFGLLSDSAQEAKQEIVRQCSILGLGMAYAGRSRADLQEIFLSKIVDCNLSLKQSAYAALSLGLSFVGQCNGDVAEAIVQAIMERSEIQLNDHFAKYFGVGLALLFMGQQDKCQATLQALNIVQHPIKKFIEIMVISSAYVGTGNILKVQKMMQECLSEEKYSETAILGLALLASSQEIGNQMAMRLLNHILHFSKTQKKKVVPIALAVLSLSNAKINVMDLLFKLCYDTETQISHRAIICLGLVGAGTNNSRVADIFRKLASYYTKDQDSLLLIRLAQGLLYMGKGMLSIQPYYSERFLLSKVGMSGLIVFLVSLLDIRSTLLAKNHFFIYFLSLAMYPKSLFVLNEHLMPMKLNVRVGQAVDVVGQAGKPKTITGFQTHTAPVLIGNGQRSQLATQQYIPIQDCVLENFVILRKNPDYVEEDRPRKKTSM